MHLSMSSRIWRDSSVLVATLVMILSACSSETSSSSTVRVVTAVAVATAAPSTTSATTTGPTTLAATTTTTTVGSTTVASVAGWSSYLVGSLDSSVGAISQLAIALDGRAVAFSYVQRSCCNNDVRGWWRSTDGTWSAIDDVQRIFVTGDASEGGSSGGPNQLVYANDRFIAVGERGAVLDVPESSRPTTWTSATGSDWMVDEGGPTGYAAVPTSSLDGNAVLVPWNQDDGTVLIRSTVDGRKWTTVATVGEAKDRGTPDSLSAFSLQAVGPTDATNGQYVMTGSNDAFKAFVAVSVDGSQWTVTALPSLEGRPDSSASMAVMFGSDLLVYGTTFTEGSVDEGTTGEPPDQATVWRINDKGAFTPTVIEGCPGGFLRSITQDPSGRAIWAICEIVDGPAEGDYVASTTQLVSSTDGVTFSPVDGVPAPWATPSTDVSIGPMLITNNTLSIAVTSPKDDSTRTVSLWTFPLA
jgi:hypothetical protein